MWHLFEGSIYFIQTSLGAAFIRGWCLTKEIWYFKAITDQIHLLIPWLAPIIHTTFNQFKAAYVWDYFNSNYGLAKT